MKKYLHILLFFVVCHAYGQSDFSVEVKHYTQLDGLANTPTSTAIEDDKGMVWIVALEGISRFDGKVFKSFNAKNGFEFGKINNVFLDGEVLWLCEGISSTNTSKIHLFHTLEERFIPLEKYLGRKLPFQLKQIVNISSFANGLIFYEKIGQNQKLHLYTSKGFEIIDFPIFDENIFSITDKGEIWLKHNDNSSLRKVEVSGKTLLHLKKDFFYSITSDAILKLENKHLNEKNKTYFTYQTKNEVGVFTVDAFGKCNFKRALPIEKWKNEPQFLSLEWFKPEVIAGANFYYYPKLDAFLYRYLWYFGMITSKGEFIGDNYSTIQMFENQPVITQNLVYNFNSEGLFTFNFILNKKKYPFRQILKKEKVSLRDIVRMKDKLYFNSGDGLFRSNADLTQVEELLNGKGEGVGLLKSSIEEDILWITQHFEVLKYNTKTDNYESYKTPQTVVWTLYENHDKQIWFYDYQKITSIHPTTGQFSKVKNSGFLDDRNTMIYGFHERSADLLWLFTHRGILEFDRQKGFTKRFSSNEKGDFYLPSTSFKHFYKDEKTDEFWLASDDGLILWQPQKGTYETFYFNHLATNKIHAIYLDDYGFFWLSTENGIVQFEKSTRKFKTYYEKDGITHHEFNRMSHFQDTDPEGSERDGMIYFGGLEGATIFHPKDFKNELKNIKRPEINIVEYHQFHNKTSTIENLTGDFYKNKSIRVNPNDGFFTLKINCTNYTNFVNLQFYYRIKEQDKEWLNIENQEFTVQKLPYGKYILQIKAIGDKGQFTDEYLEIPIFVVKPLYLKWWFWVLIAAILTGLIMVFIKWRTEEINRRNKDLEEEVRKRTAQIETDKQTIAEQAERLLELDKSKSKFFANVSHELRTPITLIQGPIQSVLNSNELGNRNFTLLNKAQQNTQNLLRLVNEILDLTKMEANKLTLDENKVAFYPFLRRIVSNFQSIADIQNIEFTFQYLINKSLQIKLDEAKFEKVLNNLLSNAFKFTPQNGQIEVIVEESNAFKASDSFGQNGILIKIKDNGRGILSDDVPYIFNRFYQSKMNTKAEGGLGIGLALSMEFVRLMNGKMWVESETEGEHQGSTFHVQIPKKEVIAKVQDADYQVISNENVEERLLNFESLVNVKSDIKTDKPHTILLVEDNHDLREYLTFLLSPFYNVITANNGKEALEGLKKPSAVISDVMMPIMDGFELLETVKSKAEWRNIPFIMLTARVEMKDRLKALRIGVDDYLIKPFDETELLTRIENLLNNYEERQAFYYQSKDIAPTEIEDLPIVTEVEQEWLEKLETTILKEMNNSIFTVDYLAEAMNESRNAFFAKVRQLTGLSPNHYIRAIRLQKAKELLETSDLLVNEIAQKVGFQSADYFSRLFKKEFGKSPSDYLK